MNLEKLLAISGMPGLYRMVGQMKSGIVVESLEDGKRFPAFASHKISALEDISIYGEDEDVALGDIFDMVYKAQDGGEAPSGASSDELKDFFAGVYPEYDRERVYVSDIKKLVKWYNILLEKGLMKPDEEGAEDDGVSEEAEVIEETTAEAAPAEGGDVDADESDAEDTAPASTKDEEEK